MSERWVKATPIERGNEKQLWVNMSDARAMGPTKSGGTAIGWRGDRELADFKEPPEHFLPGLDPGPYANGIAHGFLRRVASIPASDADGAGLVREAKRLLTEMRVPE